MLTEKVQCLPVSGISVALNGAKRERNMSPSSSATLNFGYKNQYILFLLKPVKI